MNRSTSKFILKLLIVLMLLTWLFCRTAKNRSQIIIIDHQFLDHTIPQPAEFAILVIDLAAETHRQIIVDKEPGQYLGHPTTVLLEDGQTIIAVYPKGHGRGAIVMKKSTDGGLSWSERLPVPENWSTSLEVPTIHRVVDPQGKKRLYGCC